VRAGGLVLLVFAWAAAVAGCGFHLRGGVDVPPGLSPVFVRGGGLVARSVETRLVGSGVSVTANAASAGLLLEILSEAPGSRVVAVDLDGKALAYMLTYRVRFAATTGTGEPLVEPQQLTLDRTFDDNPDVSVLGKQQELDIVYSDMADDAADQVILRLRAALANRPGRGA
jgi:LPS-assembly lipoprotein